MKHPVEKENQSKYKMLLRKFTYAEEKKKLKKYLKKQKFT